MSLDSSPKPPPISAPSSSSSSSSSPHPSVMDDLQHHRKLEKASAVSKSLLQEVEDLNLDSNSSSSEVKEATEDTASSPVLPRPEEGPLSLRDLIKIVSREVQTHGRNLDKSLIQSAMERYSGEEWKAYAFYDPDRGYTRNLIATDHSTFTLMLLCWTPGRFSPVHDHAGSHCFMRVISHAVEERRYTEPEIQSDHLILTQTTRLEAPEVAYICDDLGVHCVGNPCEKGYAVTLHLYLPPYDSCKCFYDLTGEGCESYVTYYSEHGELVEFSHESDDDDER